MKFCCEQFDQVGADGSAGPPGGKKPRDARLDALRGLFLIIMAGVHVPTPLSHVFQDPSGCNGAAEGFIFLSACLAGIVYGRTYRQSDWAGMSSRAWKRARWIYFVHLAVLMPIALVVWALGDFAATAGQSLFTIFSFIPGAVWR